MFINFDRPAKACASQRSCDIGLICITQKEDQYNSILFIRLSAIKTILNFFFYVQIKDWQLMNIEECLKPTSDVSKPRKTKNLLRNIYELILSIIPITEFLQDQI